MSTHNPASPDSTQEQAEARHGSPAAAEEIPEDSASDPGFPEPTLIEQENDGQALRSDESLGAPDQNFSEEEDAGSDGEPGAGRLGGTDEQFREELSLADDDAARVDPVDETPWEAPSTDAPLDESNAGPTRADRESFSSESEADASGAGS